MPYREYPCQTALHDWVKCFWSIEEEPTGEIQEIWPDGCLELFFSTGEIVRISENGEASLLPKFALLGLQTGIVRVRCESPVRILSARLYPYLNRSWSTEDMNDLYSGIRPELDRGCFESAVRTLEVWLRGRTQVEDELTSTLRSLYASGGAVSVKELAAAAHMSPRKLQRLFAERTGLSPKLTSQVIRFAQGWSALLGKPDLSLADLALELGYADQSHFTKEFERFGNQSPGEFRRQWR